MPLLIFYCIVYLIHSEGVYTREGGGTNSGEIDLCGIDPGDINRCEADRCEYEKNIKECVNKIRVYTEYVLELLSDNMEQYNAILQHSHEIVDENNLTRENIMKFINYLDALEDRDNDLVIGLRDSLYNILALL